MEKLHGSYSQTQKESNGISYIYSDEDGNTKEVTEVSSKYRDKDNITEFFSDNIYIGIVTKFIKSIGSNKKF